MDSGLLETAIGFGVVEGAAPDEPTVEPDLCGIVGGADLASVSAQIEVIVVWGDGKDVIGDNRHG